MPARLLSINMRNGIVQSPAQVGIANSFRQQFQMVQQPTGCGNRLTAWTNVFKLNSIQRSGLPQYVKRLEQQRRKTNEKHARGDVGNLVASTIPQNELAGDDFMLNQHQEDDEGNESQNHGGNKGTQEDERCSGFALI